MDIPISQNISLSQAADSLRAVVGSIDELLHQTVISSKMGSILSTLFLHQGVAASIMFNDSVKTKMESHAYYHHRMANFKYVAKYCAEGGFTPKILNSKRYRNQIAHVDEYLIKSMTRPNIGWLVDSSIEYRGQMSCDGVTTSYCRCYSSNERLLLHFENEIPIDHLRAEAIALLAVVFGVPPPQR